MYSKTSQFLYKFDPDWDFAKKHGQASKIGIVQRDPTISQQQQNCQCCGEYLYKQKISLLTHPKQLQFLGFGFPLYYQFLKYCIILLILDIAVYNAMSLHQGIEDNRQFCHSSSYNVVNNQTVKALTVTTQQIAYKCYTFMIQMARIQSFSTENQMVMRWISFIITLMALIYFRILLMKLQAYYEQRTVIISDYSIVIKGINKPQGKVKKAVYQFFTKQLKFAHSQIAQIIMMPDLKQIYKLQYQRQQILDKIRPFYEKQSQVTQQLTKLQKQLDIVNKKLINDAMTSIEQTKADSLPFERVFVIFETETARMRAQKQYKYVSKDIQQQYFGAHYSRRMDKFFQIKRAPIPQQIIWENFTVTKNKRICRILLGWFLSALVVAAAFVAIYFILVAKSDILEHAGIQYLLHLDDQILKAEYDGAVALVFILMFLIVLFGKLVLANLFHFFTHLQLPTTTSVFQFSFALKYGLGLFFTTALMTLAVEAIKIQNYYTYPYGLIDQQTIMSFENAFFVPLFWLVNPLRLVKIIKRKIKQGSKSLTQLEANMLMQQQEYNLGKRFGEIIETMWFVYMYSTLLPIASILSLVGLFLYYWIDKYNLLRRSKVTGEISGDFIRTSLLLLDFILILKPLGALIFDIHLRDNYYINSDIAMIVIGFIYVVIPKYLLMSIFFYQKFRPQQKLYSQVCNKFEYYNYHSQNPLYKIISDKILKPSERMKLFREANSLQAYSKPVISTNNENMGTQTGLNHQYKKSKASIQSCSQLTSGRVLQT